MTWVAIVYNLWPQAALQKEIDQARKIRNPYVRAKFLCLSSALPKAFLFQENNCLLSAISAAKRKLAVQ